jgi:uncharacterized repeat protein (TIGR03803 family)
MKRIFLSASLVYLCLFAGLTGIGHAQTYATLHLFGANPADGKQPWSSLLQGSDGNFYGTTFEGSGPTNGAGGPTPGAGTVFKLTPQGTVTTLYQFNGTNDGFVVYAGLVQGTDGNFYGTTYEGGPNQSYNFGTVFKITPQGSFTSFFQFHGTSDGAQPYAGLVQGTDGNFYGTTRYGGAHNDGTVFKITPQGSLISLYQFSGDSDGRFPLAGLVQGRDGNFYGTTDYGGVNDAGTVFKISPQGGFTELYQMGDVDTDGTPDGRLAQGTDGNFYGTTTDGGTNFYGSVYKITPTGTLTTIYQFNGHDGDSPYAGLVLGSDGNFYGTTYAGLSGSGSVFQITPQGVLTTLHNFDQFNGEGSAIHGGLVQGTDGNFYGTTAYGVVQSTNGGTAFVISVLLASVPNQISQIRVAGTNIVLGINSVSGETYQLQTRNSLMGGGWTNVPGATVTNSIGALMTVTNLGGASTALNFYRFSITP